MVMYKIPAYIRITTRAKHLDQVLLDVYLNTLLGRVPLAYPAFPSIRVLNRVYIVFQPLFGSIYHKKLTVPLLPRRPEYSVSAGPLAIVAVVKHPSVVSPL